MAAHRKADFDDDESISTPTEHENFLYLIDYINEYKNNISYESSDLLNLKSRKCNKETDALETKAA